MDLRRPGSFHRRGDDREAGAAAVEFALVLPILVMLVFGIVYFGLGYNAKLGVTAAVREGAREAALGHAAATVTQTVHDAAPNLTFSSVTVDRACPADGTGTSAKVTATAQVPYTLLFVASGTWNITVSGVMRCGL